MNHSIMHARRMENIRPLSNDERLAQWAAKFYTQGHHRRPSKPRIRVPAPARNSTPAI